MKAVIYEKKGVVRLVDKPMPTILEPRDVIVKVMRASICSSDLHIRNGGVPRAKEGVVLGHEFAGEIVETGSGVKKFAVGDRVAVNVERAFAANVSFAAEDMSTIASKAAGSSAAGSTAGRRSMSACRPPT